MASIRDLRVGRAVEPRVLTQVRDAHVPVTLSTRALALDMYRIPDKVQAAVEILTPMAIRMGVSAVTANRHTMCFISLHKGADGFILSNGAVIDRAKPENVYAMIQAAKEFGHY